MSVHPDTHSGGARRDQRGSLLVIVMIFLLVGAVIGVLGIPSYNQNSQVSGGWADRQRAIYLADSAIAIVDADLDALVTAAAGTDLAGAVDARGTGYFVRGSTAIPDWSGEFLADTTLAVTPDGDSTQATARYFVVYEGSVPAATGGALVSGSGAGLAGAATLHRFTVYVRAMGRRDGTSVVIQATRQYMS